MQRLADNAVAPLHDDRLAERQQFGEQRAAGNGKARHVVRQAARQRVDHVKRRNVELQQAARQRRHRLGFRHAVGRAARYEVDAVLGHLFVPPRGGARENGLHHFVAPRLQHLRLVSSHARPTRRSGTGSHRQQRRLHVQQLVARRQRSQRCHHQRTRLAGCRHALRKIEPS